MLQWAQGTNTGMGIGAKGGEVGPGAGLEVGAHQQIRNLPSGASQRPLELWSHE